MEIRRVHRLTYPIIGFTSDNCVLLDLDHTNIRKVKHIADIFTEKHDLEGYLIMETSANCYNVIFNKPLHWKDVLKTMGKIYFYLGGRHTQKGRKFGEWLILQAIKQASTIRLSKKGNKPIPKMIICHGKTDKLIRDYILFYRIVNNEWNSQI